MDLFLDKMSLFLAKALDVLALRHRVIANNIANVSTPGYKSKDIPFEKILREVIELKRENYSPEEIEGRLVDIKLVEVLSGEGFDNKGINDVDIDREMTKLAKNALLYKICAHILSLKIRRLKAVIKERI